MNVNSFQDREKVISGQIFNQDQAYCQATIVNLKFYSQSKSLPNQDHKVISRILSWKLSPVFGQAYDQAYGLAYY